MVDADRHCLDTGRYNFTSNGFEGEFIHQPVGKGKFEIDSFIDSRQLSNITILHADIQGFESEMLDGAVAMLGKKLVDYVFVSTHSDELHADVVSRLEKAGYVIEVTSPFSEHTTSGDGFVFASSPKVKRVFQGFSPLGRLDIVNYTSAGLTSYLVEVSAQNPNFYNHVRRA
jgi:hypothetical protein